MRTTRALEGLLAATLIALSAANALAQGTQRMDPAKARVIEHWTKDRQASAIPRDLVIDPRGLGYLRGRGGVLEPYGHNVAAQVTEKSREPTPSPFGKPSGGTSNTDSTITQLSPQSGQTVGATHTFLATVTDPEGVRSVSFRVWKGGGTKQSFSASKASNDDIWSVSLTFLAGGNDWQWDVVVKDASGKGGATTTSSPPVTFSVDLAGSGGTGTGSGVVANDPWTNYQSAVYKAAGRLYFEMPRNAKRTSWVGYVCSGTVVNDSGLGRSRILTAAHCVYDDANKAFARNVMFIPQQAESGPTDLNCSNDQIGCWVPSYGVVDVQWTNKTFPNNVQWDYAFYVVEDIGAHKPGKIAAGDALDSAAGSIAMMPFSQTPSLSRTHALGYSYSDDPKFMYCAEVMKAFDAVNWWIASCDLSGGSSGGPWIQPMDDAGSGPIISVNSWGYTTSPGMAGPRLDSPSSTAANVFVCATQDRTPPPIDAPGNDGNEGVVADGLTCTSGW